MNPVAPIPPIDPPSCWCGNRQLQEFSPGYLRCAACETLVVKSFPSHDLSRIADEAHDLYGADYTEHLTQAYGLPDFATRSRDDLVARCLHWLTALLRRKLPPADVLEIGSFHGGFVGLARLAGYRARGLDLSPALARRAAALFDVEILAGPLEDQPLSPGSLDAIVLFDVLEHLQNPRALLATCRRLLGPDGLIVIQTPCYREGRAFEDMRASQDPFLPMFIPEHLYLFSQQSVRRLLHETGFPEVEFEPAMFPLYDMFLFASARPMETFPVPVRDSALLATPGGRFALGLLDLRSEVEATREDTRQLHARYRQGAAPPPPATRR